MDVDGVSAAGVPSMELMGLPVWSEWGIASHRLREKSADYRDHKDFPSAPSVSCAGLRDYLGQIESPLWKSELHWNVPPHKHGGLMLVTHSFPRWSIRGSLIFFKLFLWECVCAAGDQTQGLLHAGQVLYWPTLPAFS
jgi:hypothetical protein